MRKTWIQEIIAVMNTAYRCRLIILTLLITSCGFQLRGSLDIPSELQTIQLQSDATPEWTRRIKLTLSNAGVQFDQTANIILNLEKVQEKRHIASYNENAKAAEYQLITELTFSVEDKKGILLIPKRELISERIYQYDDNQLAGKAEEEVLLKQEMQRDLIRQLVQQFTLAVSTGINNSPSTSGQSSSAHDATTQDNTVDRSRQQ